MKKISAWHFTDGPTTRDGQPCEIGKTYTYDGPLELCKSGLHASIEAMDALTYAPGSWLWRVECSGRGIHGEDKVVCQKRKIIAGGDATEMLRLFARRCAIDVIHLWDAPQIVVDYLTTGDKTLCLAALHAAAGVAASYANAARVAYNSAYSAYSAAYSAYNAAYAASTNAARAAAYAAAADLFSGPNAVASAPAQRVRFAAMCEAFAEPTKAKGGE